MYTLTPSQYLYTHTDPITVPVYTDPTQYLYTYTDPVTVPVYTVIVCAVKASVYTDPVTVPVYTN